MPHHKTYDIAVVGGGAAGLMAAGHAAQLGARVIVVEKMEYPAKKLGITGKGRCNITNTAPMDEFIEKVKPNGRFLRSAFSKFYSDDLITFFNEIGIKTIIERGGRVFPEGGKAVELAKALVRWCRMQKVEIITRHKVVDLVIEHTCVKGLMVANDQLKNGASYKIEARKTIIATGGMAYPATGSTGDGYKLAEKTGHSISPILPALVPLESKEISNYTLRGLDLRNVHVGAYINGNLKEEQFGEISFTKFGVTGPLALSLSREIVMALNKNQEVTLSIDLKPALDDKKLAKRLQRDFDQQGKSRLHTILSGLMPKALIPICLSKTGLSADLQGHQLTASEKIALNTWLKDFRFQITGYRPFSEAIITSGGVDTKEINQKTMASKCIEGLYFAGEILDLDAPTGGYNLQIAFSTGWIAGESACFAT